MKKYSYVIIHHSDKFSKIEEKNLENVYENIEVDVFFILPEKFKQTHLVEKYKKINFIFIKDIFLANSKSYNKYLMRTEFYELFTDYEYILIYQLDTWQVIFDQEKFVNFSCDFIGAPVISENRHKNIKFVNGRNGGVSLRKVDSFLRILRHTPRYFTFADVYKTLGYGDMSEKPLKTFLKILFSRFFIFSTNQKIWPWHLNEDIFWSIIVPIKFNWFTISDLSLSLNFCFDQEPELCYSSNNYKLPTFIHAIEKYNFDFYKEHIKELENI